MSRIGLIGDNSIEYIIKLLSIWNNGDCAVLIDWRIPLKIAEQMMIDAEVTKCFIDVSLVNRINNKEKITYEYFDGNSKDSSYIPERVYDMYRPNYNRTQEAVIIYSSGTTGRSKGVILSHYAINKNADLILEYMNLSDEDSIYIVKSLAHSSTLVGELLVGLKGKIRILISHTISNPNNTLKNIKECNITTLCVNPTILNLYCMVATRRKWSFECLKTIYTSGAMADYQLIETASRLFTHTDIFNVYGLSEAGPRVSAQMKKIKNTRGSVGIPLREVKVRIVDENNSDVLPGMNGIIYVNTPCIYTGYVIKNPNTKSLCSEWLNTGDIGYLDKEGQLFITGRADNMITIGSHNVYPETIESVILKFPKIVDCIIVPDFDNLRGNIMICYYVANCDVTKELNEFCMANLGSYEIPSRFERIVSIPTNINGKKIRNISCINNL